MGRIIERKCDKCKGAIEIDVDDIHDVAMRNRLYYHKSCLVDLATEKVQAQKRKWQIWQEVLDNIEDFEDAAKESLKQYLARDDLNNYLISTYHVTAVPDRFFQVIGDLNNGIYKKKRCNPVKTSDLLDAWKWGQKKLDDINKRNIQNRQGPRSDNERILYDLAILVTKIPQFLAYKEKQKAADIERRRDIKENVKVDYSKLTSNKTENNNLQDISSLVDDIF